jgi:hypothetical protein
MYNSKTKKEKEEKIAYDERHVHVGGGRRLLVKSVGLRGCLVPALPCCSLLGMIFFLCPSRHNPSPDANFFYTHSQSATR